MSVVQISTPQPGIVPLLSMVPQRCTQAAQNCLATLCTFRMSWISPFPSSWSKICEITRAKSCPSQFSQLVCFTCESFKQVLRVTFLHTALRNGLCFSFCSAAERLRQMFNPSTLDIPPSQSTTVFNTFTSVSHHRKLSLHFARPASYRPILMTCCEQTQLSDPRPHAGVPRLPM